MMLKYCLIWLFCSSVMVCVLWLSSCVIVCCRLVKVIWWWYSVLCGLVIVRLWCFICIVRWVVWG